jgi:hypothetical protein
MAEKKVIMGIVGDDGPLLFYKFPPRKNHAKQTSFPLVYMCWPCVYTQGLHLEYTQSGIISGRIPFTWERRGGRAVTRLIKTRSVYAHSHFSFCFFFKF